MAEVQRRGGGGGGGRPLPPSARGPPPPPPAAKYGRRFEPVDREKTCPLLLRVFTKTDEFLAEIAKNIPLGLLSLKFSMQGSRQEDLLEVQSSMHFRIGGHHNEGEFTVRGKEPKDEVQIYTWMDATLRELTDLVKEVAPEARRRDAMLSFAFVYPRNGKFVVKEVGRTYSIPNSRRPDDGSKALGELSFQIGDYLDVAIHLH